MQKGRKTPDKKKLFIIADAAVDTGFATVTHNIINNLYKRWDINVLAINYYGDPHDIQSKAKLWNPTGVQHGDVYGMSRVKTLISNIKPEVILLINDPWVAAEYVPELKKVDGKKILYTPIDAKNIKDMFVERINTGFHHVIAYTEFGIEQLRESGLTLPANHIPHGVDGKDYYPIDKSETRKHSGLREDYYIVQVVDRNQVRKRVDLALYYFSEWVKRTNKPDNVMFYYHGALQDEGWDIGQLAKKLGMKDRLILSHENLSPSHGFPLHLMKYVYNIADVKFSCTQGEGWGLTTMESMRCGIPNVVPRYSALGEWANGGVEYTDISPIPTFTTKGLNTQGGIPDMESTISALEKLYQDKEYRADLGRRGLELVSQPKYDWKNIVAEFEKTFNTVEISGLDDD